MTHYQVIVADPAWGFNDGLKKMKRRVKRSAESQYVTMTPTQIAALPVKQLADPQGCVLALWVPGSMLSHGMDVMKAWGFKHKQVFVWVKLKKKHMTEDDPNKRTRVGMGRLFRQAHEIALIGTSGKSVYRLLRDKSQRSVAFDLNQGHSIKPGTLQRRLELMFPTAKKLELYARRTRPGWDCLGNEIDGQDLKDSVANAAIDKPVEETVTVESNILFSPDVWYNHAS